MPSLQDVRLFAEAAHGGQTYGPYPYSYHLLSAVLIATRFGVEDETVLKAIYLHDVLEDTDLTQDDLRVFGVEDAVIDLVDRVTDGSGTNRKERKASMYPKCKGNKGATIVKLCDRIANVEECIKTRSKTFQMYFREFRDFKENLYVPGELEDMWNYLTKLMIQAQ